MSKTSNEIATLAATFAQDDEQVGKNNSAATRARKTLMEIVKVCKRRRDEIQSERGAK